MTLSYLLWIWLRLIYVWHLHKTGNLTLFSPLVIEIIGDDLTCLDQEAGGHRVQRIPPTEKRGRVHTSSVTVAVLDSQSDVSDLLPVISKKDLKIEWFSGTGKGGQHRNKHQNSARVTHLPTQLVEVRQGRSRQTNLNDAIAALAKKIHLREKGKLNSSANSTRQHQIGTGLRGDKVRTYRFHDDLVKDHTTGAGAKCSKVMKGRFDLLWR